MRREPLQLTVNGQAHSVSVTPQTTLLQVLRGDLRLKGAKEACSLEQCGACRVILDGEAVPSCRLPALDAAGAEVVTVEGLSGPGDALSPLQQAFVDEGAIQCGYCVAGMLTTASALLRRNSEPSRLEIEAALERNLCRCGVYPRIVRAVERAAGRPPDEEIHAVLAVPDGASVASEPRPSGLPLSLQQHPDLDDWLRFDEDGLVDFFTGKVEFGQGIVTALSQVVAEELDLRLDQVRIHTADTGRPPDEGATAGSMSLEVSGGALRQAAAEARHHLLLLAAEEWNAPWEELTVEEGQVRHAASGRRASYWDLLQDQPLGVQASGVIDPKDPGLYTLVGQSVTRLDLPAKVRGRPSFVHDMDLPGMLHGRVIRGPYAGSRLVNCDSKAVEELPETVHVVRDGRFLALVSEREDTSRIAQELLTASCAWDDAPTLPGHDGLFAAMVAAPSQDFLVVDGVPTSETIPPAAEGARDSALQARFARPFQMHAALGPSCAVAVLEGDSLTVWSHSQGVFDLRNALAQDLEWPRAKLRVIHAEGPGCYGHNGSDDVALDACLLALRFPGRPVRVLWTREQEFIFEPYGTPMLMSVTADTDSQGNLAAWRQEVRGYTHLGRPQATEDGTSTLLAAWERERPRPPFQPPASDGQWVGLHRNAAPQYRVPDKVVVKQFLPDQLLRVSAMRSLGAFANIFAIESVVEELAVAAGEDPFEFRLGQLDDERGRHVLRTLRARMARSRARADAAPGQGWGIAYSRYKEKQTYAAVGMILDLDENSGEIRLREAFIAADAGQIVNPDGLSAQLEGGLIQAASWTLHEEVAFNRRGVTSTDWDTYPILRVSAAPRVHTDLIRRQGFPVMGAGEAAMCPVPAAIANAVHNAAGIRMREMPFRPRRVLQALAARAAT